MTACASAQGSEVDNADAPVLFVLVSCIVMGAAAALLGMWLGPAWDQISKRKIADITPRLRALGLDENGVANWMRWWGISMAASLGTISFVLGMIPVGIGVTLLIYVAPKYVLDRMISQRQIKLRDQLVRATAGVANGCRAGLSLHKSIKKVCEETPKPLQDELAKIVRSSEGNLPIQDAIREVQKRLDLEAFTIFASASIVSLEQGGNITAALEKISEGLQEMQRLERKLEADSASGRKLAMMLGLFPIGFLALFTLMDPVSTTLMYTTFLGNIILCVIGFIIFIAIKWCMAILDMDF